MKKQRSEISWIKGINHDFACIVEAWDDDEWVSQRLEGIKGGRAKI